MRSCEWTCMDSVEAVGSQAALTDLSSLTMPFQEGETGYSDKEAVRKADGEARIRSASPPRGPRHRAPSLGGRPSSPRSAPARTPHSSNDNKPGACSPKTIFPYPPSQGPQNPPSKSPRRLSFSGIFKSSRDSNQQPATSSPVGLKLFSRNRRDKARADSSGGVALNERTEKSSEPTKKKRQAAAMKRLSHLMMKKWRGDGEMDREEKERALRRRGAGAAAEEEEEEMRGEAERRRAPGERRRARDRRGSAGGGQGGGGGGDGGGGGGAAAAVRALPPPWRSNFLPCRDRKRKALLDRRTGRKTDRQVDRMPGKNAGGTD
ncbi:unnamed protein product [Merluccius merluccius]